MTRRRARFATRAVVATAAAVSAALTAPGPASANDTLGEPVVLTVEQDHGPLTALHVEPISCPPDICLRSDSPPESSGGVNCSWRSRTTFNGTRDTSGAVHGQWSGMYYTTDCLNGSFDPVHMSYMFIRAQTAYGSAVYQTAPVRTCTSSSPQCSGLTAQGNDAGCSPCNGWWYLTVTASYRLPTSMGGTWPPQDPDGPCVRSGDGRQLDCQKKVGAFVG